MTRASQLRSEANGSVFLALRAPFSPAAALSTNWITASVVFFGW